jgi:hypothetical protein
MDWDPLGLKKLQNLPPEMKDAADVIVAHFTTQEQEILQKFLDRLDGAQLITVSTLKFNVPGAKMAGLPVHE